MQEGKLFYFIGLPGCGKSYSLQLLLSKPNIIGIDMDAHIQFMENDTISNIVNQRGWDYFRTVEKKALHELTVKYLNNNTAIKVIACGGGTPCFFDNLEYMKQHGIVVWFNTDIETNAARLLGTENVRPILAENQQQVMLDFLRNLLKERKVFYERADIAITKPPEDVESLILLMRL
jgi:shikimate kinase